jgi:hypothetical protein
MNRIDKTEDSLEILNHILDHLEQAQRHMDRFQETSGYNLDKSKQQVSGLRQWLEERKFIIERIGVIE